MKKLFLIFIPILLFVIGCTSHKNTVIPDLYSVNVSDVYTMSVDTFSILEIDSMINCDNLPKYDMWTKTYLKDGSTGKSYEYSTLYDPSQEIVYTIKKMLYNTDYIYIVMKRLVSDIPN